MPPFKLLTGRLPVTPPCVAIDKLIGGMSAGTKARHAAEPEPAAGVAQNRLGPAAPAHNVVIESCAPSVVNGIAIGGPGGPARRPSTVFGSMVGGTWANAGVATSSSVASASFRIVLSFIPASRVLGRVFLLPAWVMGSSAVAC